MLYSQPRGTAQQVPNSNGAFFSGAAQVDASGVIPANDEANIQLPWVPTPNLLVVFKIVLIAIHANEAGGINEYNGWQITDSNGELKDGDTQPITGGAPNANVEANVDTQGGAGLAVEVENVDAVNACAYRLFVTWATLPSPYVIAP